MRDRHQLIQEDYVGFDDCPWRMLVICIVQGGVLWPVADILTEEIFGQFNNHIEMDEDHFPYAQCDTYDKELYKLYHILKGTRCNLRKTKELISMSRDYTLWNKRYHGDHTRFNIIKDFKGCGVYAQDTWNLFVLKKPCKPEHRLLIKYAKEHNLYKED